MCVVVVTNHVKNVSFVTVPILACGGDNSQVLLYVLSNEQVCCVG